MGNNMQIDPWGENPERWNDPAYMQWLKEIWHVEIHEEPRHLWPGQWTVSGHWEDEKRLYKKYEKIWEDRRQEAWEKKFPPNEKHDPSILFNVGEDYFHWNVQTPGWSMHRDGTWRKMLTPPDDWLGREMTRDQYQGIYNSYEHACKTLGNYCDLKAPRFRLEELTDYEKHLKDFVENYKYEF